MPNVVKIQHVTTAGVLTTQQCVDITNASTLEAENKKLKNEVKQLKLQIRKTARKQHRQFKRRR